MSSISDLFQKATIVKFKKYDFFISPEKKLEGIYQIIGGFVYSYSLSSSGKKRIQTVLKNGDIFPIAWTININNARKDMYVQALTDGSAYVIGEKIFLDYINSSQKATLEIVDVLLTYLSIYVDRVENLEEDTVRAKLISRLLFFASRFGLKEGRHVRINLPITHNLIAESISVSRENVSRELKVLENGKVIFFKKRQLIITDINRLKKELLK